MIIVFISVLFESLNTRKLEHSEIKEVYSFSILYPIVLVLVLRFCVFLLLKKATYFIYLIAFAKEQLPKGKNKS